MMAVSKPLDEDLQFNMTEAWSGLQHIATMCCTMNSSRLGKYLRALVSKGKLHGTHTHTHEYRHTRWIFIINSACLQRWVKQILKSVNVGGCLASCQSNNGNWVSVCVCVCVAVTSAGRSSVTDECSFLHVTVFQRTCSCSQGSLS